MTQSLTFTPFTDVNIKALSQSNAVRIENRKFNVHIHNNEFSGPPRPELDAAWHDLFESARYYGKITPSGAELSSQILG